MTRVLVCGGRTYGNDSTEERAHLYAILDSLTVTELAHGACIYGGADIWAEKWAKDREIPYRGYPAKMGADGHVKGPARNQQMLTAFAPDLVVAFPGGRGTADMIRRARAAGIAVKEDGHGAKPAGMTP